MREMNASGRAGLGCLGVVLVLSMSMSMSSSAWAAGPAGAAARPDGVSGEVLLTGGSDVRALCAELRAGEAAAGDAIYAIAISSVSWSFAPYDGKRVRLRVDTSKGFRAPTGAWELAVVPPAKGAPGLELALPASGKEAAQLIKESRAAELQLWLWFRPVALPQQSSACVEVHGGKGTTVRLGVAPLAFALWRGKEQVAAGETEAFAALRAADGPVGDPTVSVGKAVLTDRRGNAPDGIGKTALALEPKLLECYRRGLAAEPELRGTLVVGVGIDREGRVSAARAEIDGLGAAEVSACVVARVKAARFPGGEALRFSFPVRFGASP